ncbi:MAG: hypothetical protein WC926_02880 [Candidatus Paceibacterota bacterium]|jgi:glutaredoxin
MNKKLIFSTAAFLLTSIAAISVLASERPATVGGKPAAPAPAGQIVLYYGDTCPHCKDVEAWLEANKMQEKVAYQSKEVYRNMDNSNELVATAAACGITDPNKILIPFLWTGSACLIGVPDIETFFTLTQKINEQKAQN